MEFGEILGTGWKLTRRTAGSAGLLMAIAVIPLAVTAGFAFHNMLGVVGQMIADPALQEHNPDGQVVLRHLLPLFGSIMVFVPVLLLSALLSLLAHTAATLAGWEEMNGRTLGMGELLRRSFKRIYWYAIAQVGIMYAIQSIANIAVVFVGVILGAVTMGIGLVVVQLAYQAALWYFIVATIMRLHVVVAEDRGPWHGLVGSYNLVKGNWWRTLAVLAVLGAVYGLLVLPIVLPTIIPFINFIIGFASEHRGGGPLAPDEVAVLLSHIGDIFSPLVMGLLGVLGAAFSLMSINSLTALYVDLRARRGDFGEDDDHDDLVLTFPS